MAGWGKGVSYEGNFLKVGGARLVSYLTRVLPLPPSPSAPEAEIF